MITLKMAMRNFLPRSIAFKFQIFNDPIGIQLKNTIYLGKKFPAAFLSVITYSDVILHSFIIYGVPNHKITYNELIFLGCNEPEPIPLRCLKISSMTHSMPVC